MYKRKLTEKMLYKRYYSFYYNSSKYYDFEYYNKTRSSTGDVIQFLCMRATDKVLCVLSVKNDTVFSVSNYNWDKFSFS